MPDSVSQVPVKKEKVVPQPAESARAWHPLESLWEEVDRVFEDFGRGFPRWPFRRNRFSLEHFWPAGMASGLAPAVDVADKDNGFEITAELPGLDEKNVEVTVANDILTIKGEKKEEKEEKEKDYYRSERRYGSFERSFELPAGVDQNKIEAKFEKGVLKITMPKTLEAQKKAKKIAISSK